MNKYSFNKFFLNKIFTFKTAHEYILEKKNLLSLKIKIGILHYIVQN